MDEKGMVVLPKVGPLKVSERDPAELKEMLTEALAASLTHSAVEITFLRRIQVLGAVRSPGLYPMDPTLTLADAIALAGGITNQGHPDRVELHRFGRRIAGRVSIRSRIGDSEIRSGDQIYVPERSWISRNTGVMAAVASAGISAIVAILTR